MYSTIQRLEKISGDEYWFGFSTPIENTTYTIYHEAKISSKSVKQLLKGAQKSGTKDLIGKKIYIVVNNNSFCFVQFEFDGFFIEELSSRQVRSDLSPHGINQKCNDIYSVALRDVDNNQWLNFVISESTYYDLIELLELPAEPNLDLTKITNSKFTIFKPEEKCFGLKIACSIGVPLTDTHLKAYFTKTEE